MPQRSLPQLRLILYFSTALDCILVEFARVGVPGCVELKFAEP